MNTVLIGNIVSIIGCAIMVGVGFIKKKKTILAVQCVQFVIQVGANLILGAVSGAMCGVVSLFRNLVFSKVDASKPLKLGFILIQFVLSFNSLKSGMLEWLPLISAAIFTWFLDTKSETVLKRAIIISQVAWLIYDISYINYAAAVFDLLTIMSNFAGIIMLKKAKSGSETAID